MEVIWLLKTIWFTFNLLTNYLEAEIYCAHCAMCIRIVHSRCRAGGVHASNFPNNIPIYPINSQLGEIDDMKFINIFQNINETALYFNR